MLISRLPCGEKKKRRGGYGDGQAWAVQVKLAPIHRRVMRPRATAQSRIGVWRKDIKDRGHGAIETEQGIVRRKTTRKGGAVDKGERRGLPLLHDGKVKKRLTRKPALLLFSARRGGQRGARVGFCRGESNITALGKRIEVLYAIEQRGRRGAHRRL